MKRLLLIDDYPLIRAGWRLMLRGEPDLDVAGEAATPAEAWTELNKGGIDLALIDLTMPGRSGLELVRDVSAAFPQVALLVVSMHDERVYAERVLRAGARGYIMKDAPRAVLIAAVRQILAGENYVSGTVSANLVQRLSDRGRPRERSEVAGLTDREFDVLRLLGEGKGTREIAEQLHLSPKTVDVHRGRIKRKVGAKDSTALIHFAVQWLAERDDAKRAQ